MPDHVTVTFPRDEYNQVVNLLQLMTVCGVRLHMWGDCHPDTAKLSSAFERMCRASIDGITQPRQTETDH